MTLNGKINRLYHLLLQEKLIFEQVATHLKDSSMKGGILLIAQQSNQYAAELSCYMQAAKTPVTSAIKKRNYDPTLLSDENGTLAFCCTKDQKLVKAYKKILKETLAYESLEKMLGYQLKGIVSAGTQLQLLTSLLVPDARE